MYAENKQIAPFHEKDVKTFVLFLSEFCSNGRNVVAHPRVVVVLDALLDRYKRAFKLARNRCALSTQVIRTIVLDRWLRW